MRKNRVVALLVGLFVAFFATTAFAAADITPPTGTIRINNNAAFSNSSSVLLIITATDAGSGVAQMKFSNNKVNWSDPEPFATTKQWTLLAGAGTKTVYVRFKDNAGNWSGNFADTIVVDTTLPTGSVRINANAARTNATQVTLNLTASDAAGISQMQFSNDGISWSAPEGFTAAKTWALTAGDGTKTAYARFKDNAGNWSSAYADTIILDTTLPLISNVRTTATTATGASISWNTNEPSTAQVEYGLTASYGTKTALYPALLTSFTIPLAGLRDGTTYHYRVICRDAAGNAALSGDYVFGTNDVTAPLGTVTINANALYTNTGTVILNLTATDISSGVAQMKFSNNNATWSNPEPFATAKQWTLLAGAGTKTVYVRFKDNAGNWSGNFADTIVVDTTLPTGSVLINANAARTNATQVTLNLTASDAAGISQMQFSNDSVNWSASEGFTATKTWALTTGDGTKTAYARFKDNAGNWSSAYTDTIILDTAPPTGTIQINDGAAYTISAAATLALSASDTAGTVSQMQFSLDGTTWYPAETYATKRAWTLSAGAGNKTVYARFKDAAGNWSAVCSDTIVLDTTLPTGTLMILSPDYTDSHTAQLQLFAIDSWAGMEDGGQVRFSNDNRNWSTPEPYTAHGRESMTTSWTLANGDGNKTVYARFRDVAGNWSATYSDTVVVDTTAPSVPVVTDDGASSSDTTSLHARWSAGDTVSGIAEYRVRVTMDTPTGPEVISWTSTGAGSQIYFSNLTLTSGKMYYFGVQAKNRAGLWSTTGYSNGILIYVPDTTAPTGTIAINAGVASANNVNAVLTLAAQDNAGGSGVTQMQFSNNNTTWSGPEAYATTKNWALTTGDGTKTVYVKFKDAAGNWSGAYSDTIILDTTAPAAPVVTDDGASTTDMTQLHCRWSAQDTQSGIAEYQYRITRDSSVGQEIVGWTSTGTSAEVTKTGLTLQTDTLYYFSVKAKDGAGNWSLAGASDGIRAVATDQTPPSGTVTINNNAATTSLTSVTLQLSATDAGSGMGAGAQMQFSNDNTTWSGPEAYATTKNWALTTGDGAKTVYVKFKDAAGNWSGAYSDTIILDTAAPAAPVVTDDGASTTDMTQLHCRWSAQDTQSGIAEYQYRITRDSSVGQEIVGWTSTGASAEVTKTGLTLQADTLYYFSVKAKDGAGNWSLEGTSDGIRTVATDQTPPSGTVTINNGAAATNTTSVTLSLNATDSGSGMGAGAQMQLSNDGTSWLAAEPYVTTRQWLLPTGDGTKTVYVKFRDVAGNWSAAFSRTILLDATAPTGTVLINDDAPYTNTTAVVLALSSQDATGGSGVTQMQFSNDNTTWSSPEAYAASKNWTLAAGASIKTVYAKFKDAAGNWSTHYTDTIRLDTAVEFFSILLDHYDQPLPSDGAFYNATGGDRGIVNADDVQYTWDSQSRYTARVVNRPGAWTHGGMWYSPIRVNSDNVGLDFRNLFGPYVKPEYQGQITELKVKVNNISSPSTNGSLVLRIELKDEAGALIASQEFGSLLTRQYPATFTMDVSATQIKKVKEILWIIDRAQIGDTIAVDALTLEATVKALPTQEQAFLWSYSWLMRNYDPTTGMVQDRSNFHFGDDENVSATAKAAKVTCYAYTKGYISRDDAVAIITKIADTLLNKVPRGPAGINSIWPHFTKQGGTIALPPHDGYDGTEWASGDTAYAALDLITALELIGDPNNQISSIEDFLKAIKWSDLLSADGYIGHGYNYGGDKRQFAWRGFGMETLGVAWAYASATGDLANMEAPPTDNGSGFIDNAAYPAVFTGTDRWGNDWDALRTQAADTQINWYNATMRNSYLYNSGLFGLSAGETPEANGTYSAYGVGGKNAAVNDGDAEVVVLHYPAMIADLRPAAAIQMWETLRNKSTPFLTDTIVLSPLNNMESMRVNKQTGQCTVNRLKGSWNLALQAEGWALADANCKAALTAAVANNPFLNQGYELCKNGLPEHVIRVPQDYPTIQAAIDAAASGDVISVAAGTYNESITLNKPGLTLRGSGATIQGTSSGAVISCSGLVGEGTVIRGFTITGGLYGIKCAGTVELLKIEDNMLISNLSQTGGYGIYLEQGARAGITGNTIQYSARGIQGAGNNTVEISDNYFYYCRGSYGGGIVLSDAIVFIKGNKIEECWDGAISLSNSQGLLLDNYLVANGAWNMPAGIDLYNSTVTLRNNLLAYNHVYNAGYTAGICARGGGSITLHNNLLYSNSGRFSGAAALYIYGVNLVAYNNIFSANSNDNATVAFYGSGTQDFAYNDLWGNTTAQGTIGITPGQGNLAADPLFVSTYDFHLQAGSPCRDSGAPEQGFNDRDGSRNDMGIYGGPEPYFQ